MSKVLIVTADDVGLHAGATLGALEAHRRGIVTACSVAAVGADLAGAARLLRDEPALEVGVHLTLVGGRPLSPPEHIPSLVGRDGLFLPGFAPFVRRHALGRIRLREVEVELRRQVEAVLDARLVITHANGHQHLHALPGIADVVLRLAVEYGIGFVRSPVDRLSLDVAPARAFQVRALSGLGRKLRRRARGCGLATADATIGIAQAGHLTGGRIGALLGFVDGVTELVCHPGIGTEALAAELPWRYEWEAECAALCDPGLLEAIRLAGITLAAPGAVVALAAM